METIADYFRMRQEILRCIDEAFVKVGTDFFDCRAQILRDRFQIRCDRFFLAAFKHSQHEWGSLIVARTDNGDEIAVPFERRDFVQSDLAKDFELITVDFVSGVAAEHVADMIVRDAIFDGDIADCAVDKRSQEKFGEGFSTFCISVVPFAALGRRRTAIAI